MTHADRLLRSPGTFRQLTGITPAAFERLLAELAPAWDAARRKRARQPGRRRRHTLKHQVVVVRKKKRPGRAGQPRRLRIAAVSAASPGSAHDQRVYDATRAVVPRGATGYGDTAYLGTPLRTPARKPRGGALT